jgi:hypothetical protein
MAEQSAVSTPVDREAIAFETHVTQNNIQVPDNFKSVGDWFNALKSAQGEYTKARQEISTLKKQLETPQPVEAVAQEQPQNDPVPVIPEELRIPDKPKVDETATRETQEVGLTQEEWTAYSTEFAVNGSLSEESVAAIKQKTKLPDYVINDYLEGQKARLSQAYDKAAQTIGGKDQLARVFDWASKNLSDTDQKAVNAALASPSWEVALLGLKAKYDASIPKKPTANEPPKVGGQKVGASSATALASGPYSSKAEFFSERSNPLFSTDSKFRAQVEKRMAQTNFNNLR